MKKLLFILAVVTLLFGCNNPKKSTTKLFHLVPENASLVIKVNDLETFKSDIKNNDFINELPSSALQKDLSKLPGGFPGGLPGGACHWHITVTPVQLRESALAGRRPAEFGHHPDADRSRTICFFHPTCPCVLWSCRAWVSWSKLPCPYRA